MHPTQRIAFIAALPCFVLAAYGQSIKDLGDLTSNQDGISYASSVSADGSVVGGRAQVDLEDGSKEFRPVLWTSTGIVNLGALVPGNYNFVNAVSADGRVAVGSSSTNRAFRWTSEEGLVQIGNGSAHDVSADGSVVVGNMYSRNILDGGFISAYRWTKETGMVMLSDAQRPRSHANAVSADGNVVVGHIGNDAYAPRGFRWTSATGMVDLGDLTANQQGLSNALDLSADGSVLAGWASYDKADGSLGGHAIRWTSAGMVDLGDLTTDKQANSIAFQMSPDGRVLAGRSHYNKADGSLGEHAFRWTSASGMVDLGDLTTDQQGYSLATEISNDGRVLAGRSHYNKADGSVGEHAFRWTSAEGMVDLGDLTTNQQGYSNVTGISANGSVVVGNSVNDAGVERAFIYKTVLQDTEELIDSVIKLAPQKEFAAGEQQRNMIRLLETQCGNVSAGQLCLKVAGAFDTVSSDGEFSARQQTQGMATLGYGLSPQWTLGSNLSIGRSNYRHAMIDPKNSYGLSGWLGYSESGATGLGWQMQASVGYSTQKNNITRGQDSKNIQKVEGTADMGTFAGRIAVGFGIHNASDWLLTPSVGVSQLNTNLKSYKEQNADFTSSFKKSDLKATVLDVDVSASKSISEKGHVRLSAGFEQDLSVSRMNQTGDSNIPGVNNFSVGSGFIRKEFRPYVQAGYRHKVNKIGTMFFDVGVTRDAFYSKPNIGLTVGYSAIF